MTMVWSVKRMFVVAAAAMALGGCASEAAVSTSDGSIVVNEAPVPAMSADRNRASVRVLPYADARNAANPRRIGAGADNIFGFRAPKGNDILLSKEVAAVVTGVMARRMSDAGYQVVDDSTAQFEISGTVKTLRYDIKSRDEVEISVETVLKDAATGKVLWAGVVSEKKDRFPGVSGDDMSSVAGFLREELGVVTQKTATAITAVVVAQHPELFNVVAGTKPIPGVTVLNAPAAAVSVPAAPAPAAGPKGVLKITTRPVHAKIYIGGVYYGLSPLRLELDPGVLEVKAEHDGRKDATEKVSVRPGDTTELELELKK